MTPIHPIDDLGGVILCGGESARMGKPKAWLDFHGEALLTRTARTVAAVTAPVVVVAAPGQALPPLPEGARVVRDAIAGRGPLQGLAAGLTALSGQVSAAFVCSTDAPFLHQAMIRRLAALRNIAYDIVVPRVGGHDHPLCAIYEVKVLAEVEALLAADQLRLRLVLSRARTLAADEALLLAGEETGEGLGAMDPGLSALRGVNTPEEYAAALAERPLDIESVNPVQSP